MDFHDFHVNGGRGGLEMQSQKPESQAESGKSIEFS
jgi:hypothetical protein